MGRYARNNAKMNLYKEVFNFCLDPECKFGYGLECHHIQPLSKGGTDTYENYITLCRKCHRKRGVHSEWSDHQLELLVYKFYQEQLILGLTSDSSRELNFHNALIDESKQRKDKGSISFSDE